MSSLFESNVQPIVQNVLFSVIDSEMQHDFIHKGKNNIFSVNFISDVKRVIVAPGVTFRPSLLLFLLSFLPSFLPYFPFFSFPFLPSSTLPVAVSSHPSLPPFLPFPFPFFLPSFCQRWRIMTHRRSPGELDRREHEVQSESSVQQTDSSGAFNHHLVR